MARRSNPFLNAGLGALLVLAGLVWTANTALFVFGSEPLTGEVTSHYECQIRSRRRTRTAQCAEVRWQTPAGSVGTLELKPNPGLPVGAPVPLLYDPDHQQDVRRDTFKDLWMFPLGGVGVGGIFSVIGAVGILRRRAGGL